MRDALHYLQNAGFLVYLTPYLLFGLASFFQRADTDGATGSIRRFIAVGPILGLSLGACILGALGGIWLDHGQYSWADSGDAEIMTQIAFGLAWISNIKFEVWTLEPARKRLAAGAVNIGPELKRIRPHLWAHCAALLAVLVLSQLT